MSSLTPKSQPEALPGVTYPVFLCFVFPDGGLSMNLSWDQDFLCLANCDLLNL